MTANPGPRDSAPTLSSRPNPHNSVLEYVAQGCICVVIAISIISIYAPFPALDIVGGAALALFFLLSWRRLTIIGILPLSLSLCLLLLAAIQGVSWHTVILAIDRACFLASLLALLGMLRAAANIAPEIERAGRYITAQPPGRRYLALNFGSHMFGTLINLGGLVLLLDMTSKAIAKTAAMLPPEIHELKLQRMTLAVTRGFGLVSLWSPFGFAVNALLLAMPGLNYLDVAPTGFVLTFAFVAYGWMLDRRLAPKNRQAVPIATPPNPKDASAIGFLLLHLILLGSSVLSLSMNFPLSFQQALLIVLPSYATVWAIWTGFRQHQTVPMVRNVVRATLRSFATSPSEIGVFASSGLLSVLVVALLPTDDIRQLVIEMSLSPVAVIWLTSITMFVVGCLGINPIISASVLASLVSQIGIEGLSIPAIALTIMGTWATVMCFSPFITTVAYAGALIGKSPFLVGPRWNFSYSVGLLLIWDIGLSIAISVGAI